MGDEVGENLLKIIIFSWIVLDFMNCLLAISIIASMYNKRYTVSYLIYVLFSVMTSEPSLIRNYCTQG